MNISESLSTVLERIEGQRELALTIRQAGPTEIDYLDLSYTDTDGVQISYLPLKKAQIVADRWNSKLRQTARLGRVLSKILPQAAEADRMRFADQILAEIKRAQSDIELVGGEAIVANYLASSYHPEAELGTLGRSCMRYPRCADFFGIYTANPEAVQLAVLRRDDRVAARALLWQALDQFGQPARVLDRIYYTRNFDREMLERWARTHADYLRVNESQFIRFGHSEQAANHYFTVPVKNWRFWTYPYVDTFYFIDKTRSVLTNRVLDADYRHLRETEGRFTDSDGDRSGIVPPGHVYIPELRRIAPVEETLTIDGHLYHRSQLSACFVCGAERPSTLTHTLDDNRRFCRGHLTRDALGVPLLEHDGVSYRRCRACAAYRTAAAECAVCLANQRPCNECGVAYNPACEGTERFCQACYDNAHFYCERCDEFTHNDYANHMPNETVCDDCYSEYYTYCEGCDTSVANDDAVWVEALDEYRCESCFERNWTHCELCDTQYRRTERCPDCTVHCETCGAECDDEERCLACKPTEE